MPRILMMPKGEIWSFMLYSSNPGTKSKKIELYLRKRWAGLDSYIQQLELLYSVLACGRSQLYLLSE